VRNSEVDEPSGKIKMHITFPETAARRSGGCTLHDESPHYTVG
jgi:hypothetical protein